MDVIDAGAVPTTGSPAAQYEAGRYEFATNILVVGVTPAFGDFLGALRNTMRELAPMITMETASAAVGAQETVPNVVGPTIAYWVTLRGEFTSSSWFQTAVFNRALARAVASSVRFTMVSTHFRDRVPADGFPLLERLSRPDACAGGADYTAVYARACTRFAPITRIERLVTPVPAPAPLPPPTPSPAAPAVRPPPPAPAAATGCTTLLVSNAYLRDRATFEREGPTIDAGTEVLLLSNTGLAGVTPAGTPVTLYRGRVTSDRYAGRTGYLALSASDTAACSSLARVPLIPEALSASTSPVQPAPLPVVGPSAPLHVPARPATTPAPLAPRPQPAPMPVTTPLFTTPQVLVAPAPQPTGVRWYWWALGGLLVAGIGIAVWKRREIAVWWKR